MSAQPPGPSTPAGSPSSTGARPRRPDESMTLLTEMMHRPLDPSYAAEARRRAALGLPPARVGTWRVGVASALVGLLLVVSAQTLRQPRDAVAAQKADLVSQITSQQKGADALQSQDATLRAQIAALQADALQGEARADLTARLQAAQVSAGALAVTGPGVVLTIDDAPNAAGGADDGDPRNQGDQDMGTVIARDLQLVVNGLWKAGAEAISVNGQRIGATSAIRFAGDAILVDYRPLARPYVVTAVGGEDLEKDFTATDGGIYVQGLADSYGVRYSHTRKDEVTCPASTLPRVRHAQLPGATPSPTATSSATTTATPTRSENPS